MQMSNSHITYLYSALKILCGVAGATLEYIAWLLYEDEQGRIQNKLERWWVRLSDQQSIALSLHAAFLRQIARLCTGALDRLFGNRLFSARAFSVTTCYSLAGASSIAAYVAWGFGDQPSTMIMAFICLGFILLGTAPALAREPRLVRFWVVAQILVVALITLEAIVDSWEDHDVLLLVGIVTSFALCIFFLALSRRLLLWCTSIERPLGIAKVIGGNLLLAATLLVPSLLFSESSTAGDFSPTIFFQGVAVVGVVFSLLFVVLGASMLAHRLIWPTVNRPLYAIAQAGVVRRRKLFGIVGLALLTYAGWKSPDWVRQLF